uniref:Histone chaperone domain-containing protein n=1 Tax=Monodon monoceros TaxID=40151 RepID=A0A8C6AW50_MONMO
MKRVAGKRGSTLPRRPRGLPSPAVTQREKGSVSIRSQAGSGRRGEDHPSVMRLKRYIRACGAHRNYKKLLGSCRSHKERLSVLRAELEALGMKGNPSLEKCRALKEQREEAAEVASLDITNIISGSGRPRRRTAWNPAGAAAPPGELYCRTLDSEEERPRPPPPDWSHMRGIISSGGESN